MEAEANAFAADALIPPASFDQFVEDGVFTSEANLVFADEMEISPGIGGGRLAKEGLVNWNAVSSLRPRLIFASETEGEGS